MDYETPRTRTDGLSLDRISRLPDNIIETILTLMPIRDALRTSILSKKWRYTWRTMPKLVFTDDLVKVQPSCARLQKSLLVNAIFHVLLLHNGATTLEFYFSFDEFQMVSELDQIISYLSRGNNVKELNIFMRNDFYQLPSSFFSLQGLETLELLNCIFEPPLPSNGFSCLKQVIFWSANFSAQMLQQFLSKCPLIKHVYLVGEYGVGIDFAAGGTNFTFVDLLPSVPLIITLQISKYYMKHLSAGGVPHELPTSLVNLENLFLHVCLMEQNEISAAFCLIRSSPELVKIIITMYDNEKSPVQQTPAKFLNLEDYSDLNLEYLEILEIEMFSNLPIEMEFVKLIMAQSPALKKVQIGLSRKVSADEELKMLKDLVRRPIPCASPSADLIIERPKTSS